MKNRFFELALGQAARLAGKSGRMLMLITRFGTKMRETNWNSVQREQVKLQLFTLGRLAKAYALGHYREVPWKTMLVVLAAVILVNQLEGNFLQPVVMANALSLHALVVLMALTAGTVLAGIVGAVLAVPLVAAAWAVIKVWTGRDKSDAVAEASEDIKSEVEISEEDAAIEKLEAKEKHREQHMESPQDSA